MYRQRRELWALVFGDQGLFFTARIAHEDHGMFSA